jgi:hypothetical protein
MNTSRPLPGSEANVLQRTIELVGVNSGYLIWSQFSPGADLEFAGAWPVMASGCAG